MTRSQRKRRAIPQISDTQRLQQLLFGNGQQGVFYVPQPVVDGKQVLFTDAAGTIPVTADGDPVGLMLDLSGNGNHASQSVSLSRPIYSTDGTLHWLDFDGVDDFLQSGLLTLTDKWFVSWSGAFSAYADFHGPWRMLSEGGSPTAADSNRLEEYTRNTPDRTIYNRIDAQGVWSNRESVWPASGTPIVGWANRNLPVESKVGELFDGSQTPELDEDLPYSEGTASLSIFRGYRGDNMPGKLYGYVFAVGGASGENRSIANDHLANRAGITL